MTSMRAVSVQSDQSLTIERIAKPTPGSGEILIRVEAAGLNRADLVQRAGKYPAPPGASKVLGLEVVGRVEGVGADTHRFKVGERVCALLPGGGYAEYAVADEGSVLPVPDDMPAAEACCFPEAVFTVWANVFDRAGVDVVAVIAIQGDEDVPFRRWLRFGRCFHLL